MFTLITTIFLASLLGSLHCAGMCGAFLAIAVGDSRPSTQAAYHLGRLATYVLLGTVAGALGNALNLASALAGLKPAATILASLIIVLFGLLSYLRLKGYQVPLHPPRFLATLSSKGVKFAINQPVFARAAAIGLLTTLLPCGWLYAFVATAAGTASPSLGALTMFTFWLGTLPLMISLGAGLRSFLGPLTLRLPALSCAAMVAVGLLTLSGRLTLDPQHLFAHSPAASPKPSCCKDEP